MKSLTIHQLDDTLYSRLSDLAQKEGLSLNKLVKKLLRSSLGIDPVPRKKIDLSYIVGSMTEREAKEFDENLSFFDDVSLSRDDEKN